MTRRPFLAILLAAHLRTGSLAGLPARHWNI